VRRRLPLALVALAAAPLVPWTQVRLDALAASERPEREVLYLWSGAQVKRLLPGLEGLAADIYWLRTVQYYGGQRGFASGDGYPLLRPLIEITVTLDPRLEIAYRYGAIFLCEAPPDGAGRPREGVELLTKGVRNLPQSWRLVQQLGFFRYLFLHDASGAAAVLDEAAKRPGAPFWLRTMAADILAKGGDRATARRMWQQMYEQSEGGAIKENAALRLRIIDALDTADELTRLVAVFERRSGRRPHRLEELQRDQLWRAPLVDRAGVAFDYDRASGRVSLSRRSPLWRPE
jgi:hypothetical protein